MFFLLLLKLIVLSQANIQIKLYDVPTPFYRSSPSTIRIYFHFLEDWSKYQNDSYFLIYLRDTPVERIYIRDATNSYNLTEYIDYSIDSISRTITMYKCREFWVINAYTLAYIEVNGYIEAYSYKSAKDSTYDDYKNLTYPLSLYNSYFPLGKIYNLCVY